MACLINTKVLSYCLGQPRGATPLSSPLSPGDQGALYRSVCLSSKQILGF